MDGVGPRFHAGGPTSRVVLPQHALAPADESRRRQRAISRAGTSWSNEMTKRKNKATRLERNQAIANGLRALPSKTTIPINGKLVKASDAADLFDSATTAEQDATTARTKHSQAVAAAHAAEATIKAVIPPIKSFVQHTFGERSDTAASFGFAPRKTRYVSVEVRYEAVEKLRATLAARETNVTRSASN
jgi:hypothetical protein